MTQAIKERIAQKCVRPDLRDDVRPDDDYDATVTRHTLFARAGSFFFTPPPPLKISGARGGSVG